MKLFFLFAFGLFPFFLTGQQGHIVDSVTNNPVKDVIIQADDTNEIIFSNSMGQVDLTNFKGKSKLIIHTEGYKQIILDRPTLKDGFILKIEPWSIKTNEILLKASRWESKHQVSSKLASISKEELKLQNPQTTADLLNVSGEVYIQKSQQGGGSPMIRGFATNRLLYSVDGVRMNTAIFRGGNIQNIISLDPNAVDHTQVIFGPGSVLYGSDAIGGVMRFFTLKPKFSDQTEKIQTSGHVLGRFSSANEEKTIHGDVTLGGENWAFVNSLSYFDYGDLKMGNHGPEQYLRKYYVESFDHSDHKIENNNPLIQIPTGYSQFNIMSKIRYKPTKDIDLLYAFHFSETSSYGRYDRHLRIKNDLPRYARWDYGPQKWKMHHFNSTFLRRTKVFDQCKVDLAYQNFEESRISRNFNQLQEEEQIEKVNAFSLNLDFRKQLWQRGELFYGFEWVNNDVISSGNSTNIFTNRSMKIQSRYPLATWQSLGVYVSKVMNLSNQFDISGSIRYNHVRTFATFDTSVFEYITQKIESNNDAVTGSIGISFYPTKKISISANLSTAFRSPNVDDLGKIFDSEPGSVVVPNPELKPEYAYNSDISVKTQFFEVLNIHGSVFYTYLDNILTRTNSTLNGQDSILYQGELSQVQAIQNGSHGYVYGFQCYVSCELNESLNVFSNVSYQKGYESLPNGITSTMRHVAPIFGKLGVKYSLPKTKIEVYSLFNGKVSPENLAISERKKKELYLKNKNGELFSPAWCTLNLKTSFNLLKFTSIQIGVENILDVRYRPYSSGLVAPGRNFIGSVRIKF